MKRLALALLASTALAGAHAQSVSPGNLGTDKLLGLRSLVGPVQAGGDEDGDVLAGDALLFEDAQHRRQDQPIGNGAGDVTDEDAGVLASAGDFAQ